MITPAETLSTLELLNRGLSEPVWLFGGVAVDFHAGRWTRAHSDIDLNAWMASRTTLERELRACGFETTDSGWLTHWNREGEPWRLEVVFLEREGDEAVLVVEPDDSVGRPGRYPLGRDYLDPTRVATVGGVTFRVCSIESEWRARAANADAVIPGREPNPKVDHDLAILEGLMSREQLQRLRAELGADFEV